jgi:hypothetical protein
MFVLTTLACNALFKSTPTTKPTEAIPANEISVTQPQPTNTSQPKIQLDIPVLADGVDNQCGAEKWAFRPIALYRYNGNGKDIVILDFSVHNGSDFWGKASISGYLTSLITESDKWYEPFDNLYTPFIPDNPHSPYSGTQYHRFIDDTEMISPGTTSPGWLDRQRGEVVLYTFGYEVPSDQKILTVHFSSVQIECQITQSEYGYSEIAEVSYSVENIVINSIPTAEVTATQKANNNNGVGDISEISPLCKNDYFPVVKGAKWVYKITIHQQNSDDQVIYMLWEIAHILPDGFDMNNNFSKTTEFTPIDPASDSYYKWSCLPDGLASPSGENPIPKEMQTGSYWTRSLGASGQGEFGEEKFTSLGVESITVPAGTFDAVKVQGVTRSLKGVTYFDWYVKGIGLVKTYTESSLAWSIRELVSYSTPK